MANGNGTANGTTQALATRETSGEIDMRSARDAFEPANLSQAIELATKLARSGLMPKALSSPEAIVTAVIMGRELGLTAMQSVRSIHVIEGKPALSSALIVALCKQARHVCRYFQMIESTDEIATYETHREGEPKPTRMSFTIAQGRAAGVAGKNTWKSYPAAMLRARCETALARAVYPDLVMGLYDPDELEPAPAAPRVARVERDVTPAPISNRQPAPVAAPAIENETVETPAEWIADAPPAHEEDSALPADSYDYRRLSVAIAAAKTQDDLNAVAVKIGTAKREGTLLPGERDRLADAYTARKGEVA